MNRRQFTSFLTTALAANTICGFQPLCKAAEPVGGGWNKKWIIYYTSELIKWAKADLTKRAALAQSTTGSTIPVTFRYCPEPLSRKDEQLQNDFLGGRLSDPAMRRHIDSFLKDLEAVRVAVAAMEAEAAVKWKGEKREEASIKEGTIYGAQVSARNLGVILDNSGSMKNYVDKLRAEINRDFGGCHIVEVDGCRLWTQDGKVPWFYAAPASGINPFTPERHCPEIPQRMAHDAYWEWLHDAASAILAMVDLMKVDAIYWFCDFDDELQDEMVRKLAVPVLEKKVKLYLHTVNKKPSKLLATLADKSGGKTILKAVR